MSAASFERYCAERYGYSARTGRDCDCIASVYCTDCRTEIRRAAQARHADAGHPLIPVICSVCEPASLKP